MATKILWLSRHGLTVEQLEDLHRIYGGELEIKQVSKTVTGWQDVVMYGEDCDILAVVLPPAVLADLTNPRNNMKPVIRAKANRVRTGGKVFNPATGMDEDEFQFQHLGWEQVIKIEVITRDL